MGGRVTLWARDGLTVEAVLEEDGRLTISGHDLSGRVYDEYEYWLYVAPEDVPVVVRALGGIEGDDVLPLLEAHGETIVRTGEQRWLRGLGIEPGFANWH